MRTTLLITKEKIISVAQKLFIETSFYRTTMKDIARAAKVSRRTLYTHFNSKEDIFNHIVDQKIELIEQKLEQAVRTALPADKRLKLYIKERFNLIAELMGGSQPIKETFLHNNSKIEILRENIDKQEIELLYSILRDGPMRESSQSNNPGAWLIPYNPSLKAWNSVLYASTNINHDHK